MIGGRVLDASALTEFAYGRPYVHAMVWAALDQNVVLAVPAAALTAAWARLPDDRHADLNALLDLPVVVVEVLDRTEAHELGKLLGRVGMDDRVIAGQVARSGYKRGWAIVTAEPNRLRAVIDGLDIDELP